MPTTIYAEFMEALCEAQVSLRGRPVNVKATASRLGLNQGYLSKVLSGNRLPSIPCAILIAEALGFSGIDELLDAIAERQRLQA